MKPHRSIAALLMALAALPLSASAQTTVTDTQTGETIVIDGPAPETPQAIRLYRYLNVTKDDGAFATKFEHTGLCEYRMTLHQALDENTLRDTVTAFSVRDLAMDGYEERVYAPDLAELVLPFTEGTGQIAQVRITGPDSELRQKYVDAMGLTCEGDLCTGDFPTPTLHLTLLTPTAENDLGFANMAMGALLHACRPLAEAEDATTAPSDDK